MDLSMVNRRSHVSLFFILVAFSFLAFSLFNIQENRIAGESGVPLDDSWIHFQFARNVARGYGFSYNPGHETPGSTSPLWVYILAGTYKITGGFLSSSKVLGLLFLLVAVWALYNISRYIDPNRWCAFLVALFTLLAGRLFWGVLSGMEIGLFTMLTHVGILLYLKFEPASPKSFVTTVFFGLTTLARPEGAALFAFACLLTFWQLFCSRKRNSDHIPFKRAFVAFVLHVLIFMVLVLPQVWFCFKTTGHPLPTTFYAKTQGLHIGFVSVRYIIKVVYFLFRDHPLFFLTLPFGLWHIGRKGIRGDIKVSILVLWFCGLPLLNAVINPITWHHGRYVMFLIPLFFLFSVHGCYFGFNVVKLRGVKLKEGFLLLSFICSLALLFHWSRIYAENVDNVNQMDVRMGRWIENNLPLNATVAASDVGAIAFFSERSILDTDGLVTPEVIPYVKELGREQGVFQYLVKKKPDFVVAFHDEFQFLSNHKDLFEPLFSLRIMKNTILGGERMVVYKTHWSFE